MRPLTFDDPSPRMTTESDEAGRKIRGEALRQPCAHQRLIDDERDEQGRPTGRLLCIECGAVFPDPDTSRQRTAGGE